MLSAPEPTFYRPVRELDRVGGVRSMGPANAGKNLSHDGLAK